MSDFWVEFDHINSRIYKPSKLRIESIIEEKQNHEYAAGRFQISNEESSRTARFRVAKITPTKTGQFVTFWEKDANDKNRAYCYSTAPDLLIITAFKKDDIFGQFVFPRDILLKRNILRSSITKGKMAMRVYPSWDKVTNKTALQAQSWQLEYFFEISDTSRLPIERILKLYAQ